LWTTATWRQDAVRWLDDRLRARGIRRISEVTQPRVRPWGTVLSARTSAGVVWMKAPAPGTVFEVRLYDLLKDLAPDWIVPPLAVDADRGWLLLTDGGPTLRDKGGEGMIDVLPRYAELQRHLMPFVDQLLSAGVVDMRAEVMPQRFEEALAAVKRRGHGLDIAERIGERRAVVAEWCSMLAVAPVPASLDHNDLHAGNVFVDGRIYDWGDSVVAHPFASMIVALLGAGEPERTRWRDAYLEPFTDFASRKDLVAQMELACRVGMIARTLVWERALAGGPDIGPDISAGIGADFDTAPLETLQSVLRDEWS
jgi:Phosphotransferase enzyme family